MEKRHVRRTVCRPTFSQNPSPSPPGPDSASFSTNPAQQLAVKTALANALGISDPSTISFENALGGGGGATPLDMLFFAPTADPAALKAIFESATARDAITDELNAQTTVPLTVQGMNDRALTGIPAPLVCSESLISATAVTAPGVILCFSLSGSDAAAFNADTTKQTALAELLAAQLHVPSATVTLVPTPSGSGSSASPLYVLYAVANSTNPKTIQTEFQTLANTTALASGIYSATSLSLIAAGDKLIEVEPDQDCNMDGLLVDGIIPGGSVGLAICISATGGCSVVCGCVWGGVGWG